MVSDIVLNVAGQAYSGWKSVRVTRSIESISGSFSLGVSDRWNGQTNPWPIDAEDECTLTVNGFPVIDGFVDKRRISYEASGHSLEVSGRDVTGMLVDCSAVQKTWEYPQITILTLAAMLCKPFGIPVALDPTVGNTALVITLGTGAGKPGTSGKTQGLPLPKAARKFSIDPGESAFEVLDRACRLAGVLPISDGQGGLFLTRAGTARCSTALVEGQNIIHAEADYDCSGRYAKYIVSGQRPGLDESAGADAAYISASAKDAGVRRAARVLLVRAEAAATVEIVKNRAGWESKVRAARGETITVLVQGWTQVDGSLWPLNALANVQSPLLGVSGDLLITQTELSIDDSGGRTTHLTLKRPDAFIPQPTSPDTGGLWKEISKGV